LDSFRIGLISLRLWLGILVVLASMGIDFSKVIPKEFIFVVILLIFLLMLRFSFSSLFLFYIFFEFSIVPTFFLILG